MGHDHPAVRPPSPALSPHRFAGQDSMQGDFDVQQEVDMKIKMRINGKLNANTMAGGSAYM